MTEDLGDFFALPPFKADEALVTLRRQLRDLKPLVEKSTTAPWRFEYRGKPCVALSLSADQAVIEAQWTPKLSVRPQWQTQGLSSSAEVRKFVDQIKLQMRRWDDED